MPRLSDPPDRGSGVSAAAQVVAGLRAALMLARGDEGGLRHALLSMEGAARSFLAAGICLVPFLLVRQGGDGVSGDTLPAELIGYVLGWVAFPLAAAALADASGRGPLWPLFVAAWNWTNVVQYGALVVASLLGGVLPAGVGGLLTLAAFVYAIWMEWFVARSALRISGGRAAVFVGLDLAIGLLIASVVGRLTS